MADMLKELRFEASSLSKLHGAESRHWTINPDAGTVRDRYGGLVIFLSRFWADLPPGAHLWIEPLPVLKI